MFHYINFTFQKHCIFDMFQSIINHFQGESHQLNMYKIGNKITYTLKLKLVTLYRIFYL